MLLFKPCHSPFCNAGKGLDSRGCLCGTASCAVSISLRESRCYTSQCPRHTLRETVVASEQRSGPGVEGCTLGRRTTGCDVSQYHLCKTVQWARNADEVHTMPPAILVSTYFYRRPDSEVLKGMETMLWSNLSSRETLSVQLSAASRQTATPAALVTLNNLS